MAKKEKSKTRKAAGRKAWNKRVAKARAAGKKSIKVGNRRVSIVGAKSAKKREKKRTKRAAASPETRKVRRAAAKKGAKRGKKGGKKGGKKRSKKSAAIQTVRTRIIKVPGKTRRVIVTAAAEKRHGKRRHHRHHRGHLMENPLTGVELFAGGLTMLLGLGVADMSDRYWATHALTGTGPFIDTPNAATAATTPATTTSSLTSYFGPAYPGMKNGAAVLSPMNLTRWISGGLLVAVPFIAAPFVKAPVARSALQMFGFGAFARIGGKALVDLFSGLLGSTSIGQQLYVNELAAAAQNQASQGVAVTIQLPGSVTATAAGPTGSATGLAKPQPGGCGCCGSCQQGKPCSGKTATSAAANMAMPPPPPPSQGYVPPTTPSSPGAPSPSLPAYIPQMTQTVVHPQTQVATPGVPGSTPTHPGASILTSINRTRVPSLATDGSQGTIAGPPRIRPNPYRWAEGDGVH